MKVHCCRLFMVHGYGCEDKMDKGTGGANETYELAFVSAKTII